MNLKKTLLIALAGTMCLASLTAGAAIAGRGFQASIAADVVSSYVWRGIEKHDDLAFQPSFKLNVDKPDVSVGIWTNINLGGTNSGELTEAILSADYSMVMSDFEISLGGIYYNYASDVEFTAPGRIDDTFEVFAQAEWLGGISVVPTLTVYYDLDQAEGFYGSFGFMYKPEEYHDIKYGFSALLGYASSDWNAYYLEVVDASFVDFAFDVFVIWPLDTNVDAKLFAGYSALVDEELQDAASDDNTLYGGIGLSLDF